MRKDLTLTLFLLTLLVSAPLYAQEVSGVAQETRIYFEDVLPGHWAYEAVNDLAQRGIIVGEVKEGRRIYRGEKALTRYEFAQGLKRTIEKFENDLAALKEGLAKSKAIPAGLEAKGVEGNFVLQEELGSLENIVINLGTELSSLKSKMSVLEDSLTTKMAEARQLKATVPEKAKDQELKRVKILSIGAAALSVLAIIMAISK